MTRKEQKELRRQQILQTALTLFVHQGYHGTKTWQISKEAGISEGLLFHYFPSKENLLEELVKAGLQGMSIPLHLEYQNPLEFFEHFTEMLFDALRNTPFYAEFFVFMAQILRGADIPPRVQALAGSVDIIRATIPIIQAGQQQGSLRPGDPLALSNLYWCSIKAWRSNSPPIRRSLFRMPNGSWQF